MFFKPTSGWIGIDVGEASIKVAQLARRQGSLRLVASAVLPRSKPVPVVESAKTETTPAQTNIAVSPLREDLESVLAVCSTLAGKRTAAVMSMPVCEYGLGKAFVEPSAKQTETIPAGQLGSGIAEWFTGQTDHAGKENWLHFSLDSAKSDELCEELRSTGLACQVLDSLPHSLARAVQLAAPASKQTPLAAIDWGWSGATFCTIIEGRPVYIRRLKNCGLHQAEVALENELGLTPIEARQALRSYALQVPASKTNQTPAAQTPATLISELVEPVLNQFTQELKRTLEHLQHHHRTAVPSLGYLFGGGTRMTGLAAYLQQQASLRLQPWSLPPTMRCDLTTAEQSLLGPAIALSALAWERS